MTSYTTEAAEAAEATEHTETGCALSVNSVASLRELKANARSG